VPGKLESEPLHERLSGVLIYVAGHTNDLWAANYIETRLDDLGVEVPKIMLDHVANLKRKEGK